jgi:hypothetical protein
LPEWEVTVNQDLRHTPVDLFTGFVPGSQNDGSSVTIRELVNVSFFGCSTLDKVRFVNKPCEPPLTTREDGP